MIVEGEPPVSNIFGRISLAAMFLGTIQGGLNFTPVTQIKVPAFLLGIVGGLGVGAGVAVLGMMGFGWRWYAQHYEQVHEGDPPRLPANNGPAMARGGGGGPAMARGGRGGPRGGGSASNASAKNQLESLITTLDLVTHERPTVKLTAEQKQKIREQIQKVLEKDALLESDAKEALDALQAILKDQRKSLEEAGYRWPDEADGKKDAPSPPPNPFREGADSKHLKSLQGQLEEKKT